MTPQQINRAIAKACGWTVILESCSDKIGNIWGGYSPTYPHNWIPIPDYCNDLNAMHEAEKTLSAGDNYYMRGGLGNYYARLAEICSDGSRIRATAAQRAKAFLQTVGRWEDGK